MGEIQNIHRAETIAYVRNCVSDLHKAEQARVDLYARQPYAAALEFIARERAGRLKQLLSAIKNGLFDELDAVEAHATKVVDRFVAASPLANRLVAHSDADELLERNAEGTAVMDGDEYYAAMVDEPIDPFNAYTDAQLDGTACISCGKDFGPEEASPAVMGPRGQMFEHIYPSGCGVTR